ncbi:MAG: alkaline phosphatase family protein [Marmoricola sp.]
MRTTSRRSAALAAGAALLTAFGTTAAVATPGDHHRASASSTTPIKHLVVVFGENVSFDHYFGTYPDAANSDGTPFHARRGTPAVNGLQQHHLLTANPNRLPDGRPANPHRLSSTQAVTCDQDHGYTDEQKAYDGGRMDLFVPFTDREACAAPQYGDPGLVMDYYDGNTVTALWNYAQRFAMSDNSYDTVFGPSTPGAINLVSGQTAGGLDHATAGRPAGTVPSGPVTTTDTYGVHATDAHGSGTVINDPDPYFDSCSSTKNDTVEMTGTNVGDLLSAKGVSWGWFEGGFRDCSASHANVAGLSSKDYIPHHEPFQYYASTANPDHTPPASVAEIGHDGRANHQYDMSDWYDVLGAHDLPAVSFLKASGYQDGHASYSDPVDEQHFVVGVLNRLQRSPEWRSTAVVLAYDDSDGWYDHQPSPIVNASTSGDDALNGPGACTATAAGSATTMLEGQQDRCGYGPRLPLLVLSPYARSNTVDHSVTDQTSILRFVEDNWLGGARIDGRPLAWWPRRPRPGGRSADAPTTDRRTAVQMRLELVPLPSTDVERTKAFYVEQMGFGLDHDVAPGNGMRVVQLTPPGSACSIVVGVGISDPDAPRVTGLHLVVDDIATVRATLVERGVEVSEVSDLGGVHYAHLSDPDGNGWVLQQLA